VPTANGELCGACLAHPPRFIGVSAAFSYTWPLAPLIHHFKYGGNITLARLFARAIAERLGARPDLLIAMPLTPQRLRERGFNQAHELAKTLSRDVDIPLASHAVRRVRDSAPQALLPWSERAKNVRRAFVCDSDLSGLSVAVVDDVLTTGSTLNELARNLLQAGAREVHGWVAARALRQ
jgi:ComF family protein